ncbi:hypothetical protein FOZ63_025466 [Perkinsus olseni]|uniref:Putative gamma-glutamylcyclotransferase n=1 Tax=Perkinsus olseni TaxID=32597 RepID=A0A7J6RI66_PEROL|nr:hypothetical protein FOZ63_025466 [Perkinsus olseni]
MDLSIRPIFVYGTLMSAELRSALLGREVPCCTAVLPASAGYRRLTVNGERYPALIRETQGEGQAIVGQLLSALTAEDLKLIVEYEGDEYFVSTLKVMGSESIEVEAAVSLWKEDLRSRLGHKGAAFALGGQS